MTRVVGLPAENVTILQCVELDCHVRETIPLNLTLMEAGVPGRIQPGRLDVSLARENVIILHSVVMGCHVRVKKNGNLSSVLQVDREIKTLIKNMTFINVSN